MKNQVMRLLARPSLLRTSYGAQGVMILMFHGFRDSAQTGILNSEGKHLLGETFDSLLSALGQVFSFISLTELIDRLEKGNPLPKRSAILTFDDGYESNYRVAFPVLKRHEAPATVFLATRFVRDGEHLWTDRLEYALERTQSDYLDFAQERFTISSSENRIASLHAIKEIFKSLAQRDQDLRIAEIESALNFKLGDAGQQAPLIYRPLSSSQIHEMSQSGLVDFGAHSHTHRIIGRCDEETAREEIRTSRDIVSSLTGKPCDLFCYPNGQAGDFDLTSRRLLGEEGFRCALTTIPEKNVDQSDPFTIGRLGVSDRESPEWTLLELCGLLPFLRDLIKGRK